MSLASHGLACRAVVPVRASKTLVTNTHDLLHVVSFYSGIHDIMADLVATIASGLVNKSTARLAESLELRADLTLAHGFELVDRMMAMLSTFETG